LFYFTMNRQAGFFVKSAGLLLLITALAKLYTVFVGHTPILSSDDPIFAIPFRIELFVVAVLEITISGVCFFSKRIGLQLGLIAWLATSFATYRLGLWLIGIQFCKCLGSIPDVIHLSAYTANIITVSILAYLLLVSYTGLIGKWLTNSLRS